MAVAPGAPGDPINYQDAIRRRLQGIGDLGTNALQDTQNEVAHAAQIAHDRQVAADQAQMQRNMMQMYNLPNVQEPSYGGGAQYNGQMPGGSFGQFLNSISQQESGGNYGARNASSGAMGKYQIMPGNLGGSHSGWDYQALGRDVTPAQFMASPAIQESIAQYMLRNYYNKYGPAGAAVAWYAGEGAARNYHGGSGYNAPQGAYPSINGYAQAVVRRMGR